MVTFGAGTIMILAILNPCCLKIFLFLALAANQNFTLGHCGEHSHEIILKLDE